MSNLSQTLECPSYRNLQIYQPQRKKSHPFLIAHLSTDGLTPPLCKGTRQTSWQALPWTSLLRHDVKPVEELPDGRSVIFYASKMTRCLVFFPCLL
ncbi:hypothetical protein CEXT_489321 [Caerostris extrusa]|uniref:Uncharacterized protein n=1 Tax=Caerostris extrusa TaxID=172846 RepID=A0AAV4MQ40_CAEEX|nr:hypothetical protein CEXT_489321 [Caerostris extrusa]